MRLSEKLKSIPSVPGIYLFYNFQKQLIYVGKATTLRNRVRSYFLRSKEQRVRNKRPIETLIDEVFDIKWAVTDSVLEAIILEANYIKKYQPKYNVEGKDDKSWNYLCITTDLFPRVIAVRKHELDLREEKRLKDYKIKRLTEFAYIFGPYPGLNTKATMGLLRKLFYISTCQKKLRSDEATKLRSHEARKLQSDEVMKPCLYYQMGQCLGVCTGEISPKEYKKKVINPLIIFLKGGKKKLIATLEKRMRKESEAQNYEEAARVRNQISQLRRIRDVALLNKSFFTNHVSHNTYQNNKDDRGKVLRDTGYVLRVEGYDISNLGSTGKVGSMVVFMNGEPDKNQYRKFRIKNVVGQSDVDCLTEILERRLKHSEWSLPDLFLVDGGKPQVGVAKQVLAKFNLAKPLIGIAKGPERKKNEFIFSLPEENKDEILQWIKNNEHVLINVRDEAHRFAINYQRKLREINR